ncbi:hypothetical protein G7046_g8058 [Stylonectria norvegica]|nr:hypothetical protein G7046_g8058 [Stylonectria norvegica]
MTIFTHAVVAAVVSAVASGAMWVQHQLQRRRQRQREADPLRRLQPSGRRRYRARRGNPHVIHPGGSVEAYHVWWRMLNGSPSRFFSLFRMTKPAFFNLCDWLRTNTTARSTRYQTLEQKLMIFLFIVGHGTTQREASSLFCVSQSSVSVLFRGLLLPLLKLHRAWVTLPPDDYVAEEVELDPKQRAFSGCIGAIDGVHISAHVPGHQMTRFLNRHNRVTQNVLAAVLPDSSFSFVLAGAEGRIHDANLARLALGHGGFKIPEGRFYLGDAGFGLQRGIITPYPNTRYHLADWVSSARRPQNPRELYNLRHARIRVVVERTFGMLKRKFKILRDNPSEYSFGAQILIVYACTGLWNFILKHDAVPPSDDDLGRLQIARATATASVLGQNGHQLRDSLAQRNWVQYQEYLAFEGADAEEENALAEEVFYSSDSEASSDFE